MLNKHLLVIILLRKICSRLISSGPISPHSLSTWNFDSLP